MFKSDEDVSEQIILLLLFSTQITLTEHSKYAKNNENISKYQEKM